MSILRTSDDDRVFFESTLLEYMRLRNNANILSILQNEKNPCQLRDAFGRTLLHLAADYANNELVQYLIDFGADVDAQNQMNETPLMLAVMGNHVDTVKILLRANADIFIPNIDGQCALGKAFKHIKHISKSIVKAILRKVTVDSLRASKYVASDVFYRDCPIYRFIRLKNADVTKILLDNGSPINVKDPTTGETALHLSVMLESLDNVELLLKYNADVNAKETEGFTPLGRVWCCENEDIALTMIKLLIDAGAVLFDPVTRVSMISQILEYGTRQMVHILLQCPAMDLQFNDEAGLTPLHYLSYNSKPDIFEELQNFDFDVNIRCLQKRTPLHCAAAVNNLKSLKFLLDRGADVNAKDFRHQTPLLFSILSVSYSRMIYALDCIDILLDRGADPHIFTEENGLEAPQNEFNIEDELIKPIFAQLVLLDMTGRPIQHFMRNCIESCQEFKIIFDSFKPQLDLLKQIEIIPSVSLFDFLTVDDNRILWFARNKKLFDKLIDVMLDRIKDICNMTQYYCRKLHERFSKFYQLVEWRLKLVAVIDEVLTDYSNLQIGNIAEKIVDYIQSDKWKEIA